MEKVKQAYVRKPNKLELGDGGKYTQAILLRLTLSIPYSVILIWGSSFLLFPMAG